MVSGRSMDDAKYFFRTLTMYQAGNRRDVIVDLPRPRTDIVAAKIENFSHGSTDCFGKVPQLMPRSYH